MKFRAVDFDRCRFVVNKNEFDKIALNKSIQKYWYFSYISVKRYVVDIHQKRLAEGLLMSTHNISFHGEIRKILSGYPSYWSGTMNRYPEEG